MLATIVAEPGPTIRRRTDIAFVPAIGGPLPGIAEHAVESERVGCEAIDISENAIIGLAAAAIAVRIVQTDSTTPPTRRRRSAARGIFPFCFARQPIWTC